MSNKVGYIFPSTWVHHVVKVPCSRKDHAENYVVDYNVVLGGGTRGQRTMFCIFLAVYIFDKFTNKKYPDSTECLLYRRTISS